jgi:two-component system, OmpR family, response regulator
MPKILVVDDDEQMVEMITDYLSAEGYTVEATDNGVEALSLMKSFGYAVIVLDWEMPGRTGPDVCQSYRDWGGQAPIIMLTGKGAIEEKEKGFLSGADDYLTKPFHPKELSMRIKALLGRFVSTNKNLVTCGCLTADRSKASLLVGDVDLKLPAREFDLLEFMMRHPEQVFSSDALIDHVWKSDAEVSGKAVRVCISRVRSKLEQYACPNIVTVPGFGYKLSVHPE